MPEIPDYKLVRKIGEGAYGEIWLGISVTGVYRAIKFIERAKFEHDRPYEREFNGIKQYEPVSREHPGLMDILHIGRNEEKQFFYYVMELGDDQHTGQEVNPETYTPKTLRSELTARESLSIKECLEQGAHLARALGHLHSCGLAHRDVKPANIIYVKGKSRLADIGLVKALDDSVSFAGTIGYVPLEGPGRPTGDIFSLGKVLYEMLTGMDRTDFPTLPDHFKDDTRPGLDKLNRIVFKACEHKPDKRYQRADQLATDLEELIGQDLTTASAPAVSSIPVGKLVAALAAVALVIFGVNEFKDREGAGEEKPSGPSLQTEVYIPIDKNKAPSLGGKNVRTVLADTVSVPDRSGKEGGAIQFGENSSLVIKNLQNIKALSLWAYLPALRPGRREGNGEYLFDWRVEDQGNVFCQTDTDKFRGQFEKFYLDGELIDPKEVMIPRDKWIHVHVEFSEEFVKEQSKLSSSTLTLMNHHRGNERLAGNLDDIRLYDQILSAGEIRKLYEEEKPLPKPVVSTGQDKYERLKEGLIAYYPFSANAKDESGNGNDGELNGAKLTDDLNGERDNAYSFDGENDYIITRGSSSLEPSYLTISAWIHLSTENGYIVSKLNYSNSESEQYLLRVTGGSLEFAIKRNSGGNAGVGWHRVSTPSAVPLNQWVHVIGTWDGESLKAYINGQFSKGNTTVPAGPIDTVSGGDLQIGRNHSGDKQHLKGKMDNIRIYNRSLSAKEVAELHEMEKPKINLEKGLLAYYPFNGNAKDESGNGNHGRVEGATGVADRHGKEASAYSFDGENDSIETGPFTPKIEAYTYSIWARPGRSDTWQTFISSEEVPSNNLNQVWLGFHSSNGVLRFHPNPSDLMDSPSGQVKLNEWSHFACSNDGEYAYFYFNGNLIRRAAVPIESFTDSFKINIGRDYANNPEFYNGLADDLRIYDRALSKEEIKELYNLEKPETALEKGLVAYYPFNGSATDESGNGNHGRVEGATGVTDRHGKERSAYQFDGKDDFIVVPEAAGFEANMHTISFWFYISEPQGRAIIGKDSNDGTQGATDRQWLIQSRLNGKILADLWASEGMTELYSTGIPEIKKWNQIVQIWDGKTLSFYINGVLDSSTPAKGNLNAGKQPLQIGVDSALKPKGYFTGMIDDVRIYDRALSKEEIKELYNLEMPKLDLGAIRSFAGVGMNMQVNWSPDGKLLASGSTDNTVRVWDAVTGKELRVFEGHEGPVECVSWSPDGKRLASGGKKHVTIWDYDNRKTLHKITGKTAEVWRLSWSPDGKLLASGGGSWDNVIEIWNTENGELAQVLKGHTADVTSVAWSPDGKYIASTSIDTSVKIWNASTGKNIQTLKGEWGWGMDVAWSPDGRHLARSSWDHSIKVWDSTTWNEVGNLTGHTSHVHGICWDPAGKYLASASRDSTLKVWDVTMGKDIYTLKGHDNWVLSAHWSPDGKWIASGSSDKTVKVWAVPETLVAMPKSNLEKGLVAYYPFNGNAKDESGNGNDGTLNPGQFGGLKKQVKDRHGKLGQAFFFDGHSTITVENHPSLDFSEALTISVWVNNAGAGSGHPGVIANSKPDDPNTLSYGLLVGESGDSRHRFTLNAINRQNAKDWFMELQGWEIKNRQQWSHVVATYNGMSANIYLNGQLAKSMPAKNQKIEVLKTPILIGSVGGLRYSGDMDDLRLYSRGLSAKEVKELYNLEKPKADIEKGLVAFYPFNANAADESGNGNHGKVEGATRVADRHGKEVSAYQFDGKDDFIDLGKIRFGNEVTFSAWVKNESDDHVSLFGNSDGQEGGDAGPYVYSLALGLGRDGSVGWDVSTDGVSRRGLGSPPGGIKAGRMHHIVCTYGQGKQEIYIDGKFVTGKKDTPLAIHNSGLPVVIGASRAFVRPIFNGPGKQVIQHLLRGQMDDVRIYSRLLSSEEVAELYSYERPKID